MSFAVEVRDLTVRYGRTTAVDSVSFDLQPGVIYGLLGRNGTGKTSLLSTIAAFQRASAGTLRVGGEDPYENARIMASTCLIREGGDFLDEKTKDVLRYAAAVRPAWDAELAARLVDLFELPLDKKPTQLSRGKRSALGVVVGLASRAPLTMFDEAYLGLDAPSRYAFYDALLEDYAEHPRTIVLSSHLIEEVERLFERVIILDAGRVLVDEEAETLRSRGTTVTGPAAAVDEFTAPWRVVARKALGPTVQAIVVDALPADARTNAAAAGLELGSVPLQDLFVHLTSPQGTS
ncbi:MAG: ABC transporter ATP-binding protein [Actinomycetales bacterium]|nr:ABC transporter ATP-binding protein [Actinomycetales bacterium]